MKKKKNVTSSNELNPQKMIQIIGGNDSSITIVGDYFRRVSSDLLNTKPKG